ncbi:cysteine-rich DPF motif domain-containing protein 1 isoform 5-T11 [Molossus nigricans]
MESLGNGFFSLHSEAVSMAREAEHRPVGVFECQLCALAAPYSYVGQKPPDTQSVIAQNGASPSPTEPAEVQPGGPACVPARPHSVPQPPGGELRHEGPLHPRQGRVPDPGLQVQRLQPAGW